ncbi:MAG: TonB-dependent receptor [Lysobacter sp.]|nr:TonB-dependent receptor [Lysobacter sp.]
MRNVLSAATALVTIAILTMPAHGQEVPSKNGNTLEASDGVEDIVVTAERRSTNVQDVPIAITAIGGDELKRANIIGTRGLSGIAPNVNIGQDGRGIVASIRGISSANVTASRDPSVAFHVDGVYMSRPTGATGTFYDLDRVEILRGPQGTLYGRNSTGGTINVITARPRYRFEGSADTSYGNYDAIQLQGMLNIPIVDDKIAFRIAAIHSKHDGYARSTVPGTPSLDDQNDQAVRATLLVEPSDNLQIILGGDYQKQGDAGLAGGGLNDPPRRVTLNTVGFLRNELYGGRAEVTWSLPTFDVVSLSALRHDSQNWLRDGDGTVTGTRSNRLFHEIDQFSQEVRFVSTNSGPLKWIVGGFYLRESNDGGAIAYTNLALTTGTEQTRPGRINRSRSIFGQFDYTLFDRLTLTAGGRQTWDDKRAPNGIDANFNATGYITPNTYVVPAPFEGKKFTYRLGSKYDIDARNNVYFNISRGYKAGGFNSRPEIRPTYLPETLTAYEIGTKNRFADNTIQLNLSGFYYDYTDFQVNAAVFDANNVPFSLISNAGAATVKGVELEGVFQPIPALRIDGSVGYLSTRFTSLREAYDSISRTLVDVTGNRLPRAPEFTWRLTARYDAPLGSGKLSPNVSIQGQSSQFFTEFNDRVIVAGATTVTTYVPFREGGWAMANANLRYEAAGARWYVEAFGQNLFDKTVLVNAGLGAGNLTYAPPRIYGVRAGAKF